MSKSKCILLIAKQRSGTHLLQSLLSSLPYFSSHDEVFHQNGIKSNKNYFNFRRDRFKENPDLSIPTIENIKHLFDSYFDFLGNSATTDYCITDIKYNSVSHFVPIWHSPVKQPTLITLAKQNSLPIIHLVRENVLEAYASMLLARKNKQYAKYRDKSLKFTTININPQTIVCELQNRLKEIDFFRSYLDNYKYSCYIKYSEILEDQSLSKSVKDKIKLLLKVNIQEKNYTPYAKMAPTLEEMIENYDEVLDILIKNNLSYLILSKENL